MKTVSVAILLTALLLLIASCGETGFFLDDTDEPDFIIDSLDEGSVLKRGDDITVALLYDEGVYNPETLEIRLADQDEEVLGTSVLSGADLVDPLPPVSLPEDLEPGFYTITYTVRSGEEIISQESFPFFYTDEDYLIQGISTYPPVLLPGGSGLLQAELQIPEGADPYLRWSTDDILIFEGLLSEGADRIEWQAPDSSGLYVVTLELFPYGPGVADFYTFHSTVSHQARMYVGDKQVAAKSDLLPEDSYLSLFHFKGALVDDGIGEGSDLVQTGRAGLDILDGVFGYYLDGTSGFMADRCLLPLSKDAPAPFSVTFRFLLQGDQAEKDFFIVTDDNNVEYFRIFTDLAGELFLSLNTEAGSALVSSSLAGYDLEEVRELTVSVVPREDGTLVQWFADGMFTASADLPFIFALPESAGYRSVIGGDNGWIGLLDEFGVYTRSAAGEPSAERRIFYRLMEEEYGNTLLLADGFDGFLEPDTYELTGTYSLNGGSLGLSADSGLVIPDIDMSGGEIRFILEMDVPEGNMPLLSMHPEREDTVVFSLGPVVEGEESFPFEDGVIDCRVSAEDGGLTITVEGLDQPYRFEGDVGALNFLIHNENEESAVFLKSLLIYSTSTEIAESKEAHTVPVSL